MKRKMSDASRVSMQMPKEGIGGGLSENQIVVYQPDSVMRLEVRFDGETVWLPQPQIAELFSCSVENVRLHLKNIYAIGELDKAATSKESLEVRKEGMRNVTRKFIYYNLDAIISIGYRVNSIVGVRFRHMGYASDKRPYACPDNAGYTICRQCCAVSKMDAMFIPSIMERI